MCSRRSSRGELQLLADDIRIHGLRSPVVVMEIDGKHWLIDGRNRLDAMELAGLPMANSGTVIQGTHEDAAKLAISRNIRRRHLSKGQQADLIIAALKAAGVEHVISPQDETKIRPGQPEDGKKARRGRPKGLRGQAIDAGDAAGISRATMNRAMDREIYCFTVDDETPAPKTPEPRKLSVVREEGRADKKTVVTEVVSDGVTKTTVIEPDFVCPTCGFTWTHNCLGRA
jgi:ParB/Sulfiredoxin domain